MTEPSVLRLNLLRAGYLLLVVGIGSQMWPQLITEGPALEVMHGVALSMLAGAVPVVAAVASSSRAGGSTGNSMATGRPCPSQTAWSLEFSPPRVR